jgi:hypothetical protein
MKRRARAIAATLAPVRRLAMLAVLLAFAFQAYAVQTHIHGQPAGTANVQQIFLGNGPAKPLSNDPLDPATCKLCQEMVHAGAAITPVAPELVLVLAWVAAFLPPALLTAPGLAPETGWQSRAPPQH